MRRFIILLFAMVAIISDAKVGDIILIPKGSGPNRDGFPMYFDIPEVFYDDNPKAPLIIIDGDGAVSYYDVEISSPVTNYVEISTQVDGTYDTIDITSLAPGTHVITIESPSGNIFEGTFTTY